MPEYDLCFSSTSSIEEGSFKLVELPSELAQLVEDAVKDANPVTLTIKGESEEEAVLCTADRTYSVRSIVLSNSILIVTAPDNSEASSDRIVIRDQVCHIVELLPTNPKLQKLVKLLRGREYDEAQIGDGTDRSESGPNGLQQGPTYQAARSKIQASDVEFDRFLHLRHVLNIDGQLRPIAPDFLSRILELVLNLLVSLSLPHDAAPIEELLSTLADEHEISRSASAQVMSWFGNYQDGKWTMNVEAVVKELGLSILRNYKDEDIDKAIFIKKWKLLVGDVFESAVALSLLSGHYIVASADQDSLIYFPASALPAEPSARFADLFLTRPRWKKEDILPFLVDIAVDSKEQEKLLLKYARVITTVEGIWYTTRSQHNR